MKTTWLKFQIAPAAPSLGDLAAWLTTAAAAWVPGSPPVTCTINYEDLKTFMLAPELQEPLSVHGTASFCFANRKATI